MSDTENENNISEENTPVGIMNKLGNIPRKLLRKAGLIETKKSQDLEKRQKRAKAHKREQKKARRKNR